MSRQGAPFFRPVPARTPEPSISWKRAQHFSPPSRLFKGISLLETDSWHFGLTITPQPWQEFSLGSSKFLVACRRRPARLPAMRAVRRAVIHRRRTSGQSVATCVVEKSPGPALLRGRIESAEGKRPLPFLHGVGRVGKSDSATPPSGFCFSPAARRFMRFQEYKHAH